MSDEIYLAQTDTTVGFLSSSKTKLNRVKNRPKNKQFLITTTTFKTLKSLTRVPNKHKKMVRRARKTTFIYPNAKAIRVVKESSHYNFLKKFDYLYSTSANESGKCFDRDFALLKTDVIVEDRRGFSEKNPSKLIKLSKKLEKKLR
jgi:tRNA A37 threonylcarbamoyladenosine synthetase subunit TsaC/SUA5/YrdC